MGDPTTARDMSAPLPRTAAPPAVRGSADGPSAAMDVPGPTAGMAVRRAPAAVVSPAPGLPSPGRGEAAHALDPRERAVRAGDPAFHLAQLNLARFRAAADDPANAAYRAALAEVDAAAEGRPGFVWRLRDAGQLACSDAFSDPRIAANLSVWTDLDALAAFVYRDPAHRGIMARRREWFDRMEHHLVLWWVPAGHRPGLTEGRDRLAILRREGPGPLAFTPARSFPAPG